MDPRLDPRRELYLPAAFDGAYVLPDGRYGQHVGAVEGGGQVELSARVEARVHTPSSSHS